LTLTDPAELKALLSRYGLTPQKRWGQHFLRSPKIVHAILSSLEDVRGVLEVGPGIGVLTSPMSILPKVVIALEIDPLAIQILAETAPLADVRHQDALTADLVSVVQELPEPRALVSNMPYSITGPLLTAFAGVRRSYAKAVLMMQREVGERLLASCGDRAFGSLSVFMQLQFFCSKICDAPAGAFMPPPRVDSVVLELVPRFDLFKASQEEALFATIRSGFRQPRKSLKNNLRDIPGSNEAKVDRAIHQLGLRPLVRPHEVPLDVWVRLAERSLC